MGTSVVCLLSERLKAVRLDLGLSQTAFSAKLGVNKRTYQRLEAGDTDRLECGALAVLAGLGVDLRWLITGQKPGRVAASHAVPAWLVPLLPLLGELDEKGRDQLTGWVRGYVAALPQKKHAKGKARSRKAS